MPRNFRRSSSGRSPSVRGADLAASAVLFESYDGYRVLTPELILAGGLARSARDDDSADRGASRSVSDDEAASGRTRRSS